MKGKPAFSEHNVPRGPGRVYARDYDGIGPAFVLMHGFPDNLRIYDDLIPYLTATGRRVVLIIGGGIAAYKCLELIRRLRRAKIAREPSGRLRGPVAAGAQASRSCAAGDRCLAADLARVAAGRRAGVVQPVPAAIADVAGG